MDTKVESSEDITSITTTTRATAVSEIGCNHLIKSEFADQASIPHLTTPGKQASTVTNAAKKIRRAFSMPRNLFRWSRKFKTQTGKCAISDSNSAMTICVGGGHNRADSILSLSSFEAVCKDTNGNLRAKINTGKPPEGATTIASVERENYKVDRKDGNSNFSSGRDNTSNRILRRSSFRKFINRIAKHISLSVNFGANKRNCPYTSATSFGPTPSISALDRVPPIGGHQWPADQTPGVMGLKNHGNTCFMNAVLQCLSHTDILAEYFVLDQYKADLKRRNKINSRKFGTKGELTEQLANVLKALWTCKYESEHSTSFKIVVERYGSQFRSSTQHDAQEFLFWLLDKVHEDLNTATKRRYKSVKNTYGRPDDVIAAETLANHIRCNNSFVQAVFQAQFRSSLTCPRCKKQSNTFDPFHCISVQLPQFTQQTIFVTVIYIEREPRQMKLGVLVPAGSTIVVLREQLHEETGISIHSMVLVDISKEGFTRVFYDSQPVSTLNNIETIYCIEVARYALHSNKIEPSCGVATVAPQFTTSKVTDTGMIALTTAKEKIANSAGYNTDILLLVANVRKTSKLKLISPVEKDKKDDDFKSGIVSDEFNIERFGTPFSMSVPRDCSYTDLQKRLLQAMSPQLKSDLFFNDMPLTKIFQLRLQDPSADPDSYLEQVQHPLLTEMIDMALSVLSPEAGPSHIKLVIEWSDPEQYFTDLTDTVVQHESVARLLKCKKSETATLSLEQCLEHYTKAETLSAEDAWRCPHCQQYLPVVKTLGLWSLPDILIVHFKRFRQHQGRGQNAAKLTTMVKFPLNAFDMAPHLARSVEDKTNQLTFGSNSLMTDAISSIYRSSAWRRARMYDSRSSTLSSRDKDTLYDLYAVCYHQGDTLETGHYTAACKNPYDRQWYKFDDQRVCKVPNKSIQEEIINNEAYMLFYQRRVGEPTECSGSGFSSSSGDHWVSRIAPPMPLTTVKKLRTLNETSDMTPNKKSVIMSSVSATATTPEILDMTKSILIEVAKIKEDRETEEQNVKPCNGIKPEVYRILHRTDALEKLDYTASDNASNYYKINGNSNNEKRETLQKLVSQDGDICISEDNKSLFVMDEDHLLLRDAALLSSSLNAKNKDLNLEQQEIEIDGNSLNETITKHSPKLATKFNITSTITTTSATAAATLSTTTKSKAPPTLIPTSKYFKSINKLTASREYMASQSSSDFGSCSSSSSLSSRSSPNSQGVSMDGLNNLKSNLNVFSASPPSINNDKERLHPSRLKSNTEIIAHTAAIANANEFRLSHHQHYWNGTRSSVSAIENATQQAHALNLRHSFSTSSNYKLRDCSETLSSMLCNSANTFSEDALIFSDQQNYNSQLQHHSLIVDDDDTFMDRRSLWIRPMTPHKLITVSPKN